jgi:hypothetical protein
MVIRPAITRCRLADNKVRKKTKRERENRREKGRKEEEGNDKDRLFTCLHRENLRAFIAKESLNVYRLHFKYTFRRTSLTWDPIINHHLCSFSRCRAGSLFRTIRSLVHKLPPPNKAMRLTVIATLLPKNPCLKFQEKDS